MSEATSRCPSDGTLLRAIQGELRGSTLDDVELHLEECDRCLDAVAVLARSPGSTAPTAYAALSQAGSELDRLEILRRGSTIGRYVVLDALGRGASATVYRARDPELERDVAVKLLSNQCFHDSGARRRFAQEARLHGRLSHPNVVHVYDVGCSAEQTYIAMELVCGGTLRQWLASKPRSRREIVDVFCAAGEGLAAAHDAGLVHRDFKPQNLLVGDNGSVLVADFGLAIPCDVAVVSTDAGTTSLRRRMIVGTPAYMSPEQRNGDTVDARSDQFSFCVAFQEALLVGARDDSQQLPRGLRVLLERGLQQDPQARFASLPELLAQLRRLRRPWLRPAMASSAVLIAASAYAAGAASIPDDGTGHSARCTAAHAQFARPWGDSARRRVKKALLGTGVPYASTTWETSSRELDRYADELTAMQTEVCETVPLRPAGVMYEYRMSCLEGARAEFQAAIAVLEQTDATSMPYADQVALGLPPISRCSGLEPLPSIVPGPSANDQVAVDEAGPVLASARALRNSGQYAAAERRLHELELQLAKVRYPPLHAELLFEQGLVQYHLGHPSESEALLQRALRLEMRVGRRAQAASAATALIGVIKDSRQALQHRPVAEGLTSGYPSEEARVHQKVGEALNSAARYAEAGVELRHAISKAPDNGLLLGGAYRELASVLRHQGDYAEAEVTARLAIEVTEPRRGAQHPGVGAMRHTLAAALYVQGKYAEARDEAVLATEIFDANGANDVKTAQARDTLAAALAGLGQLADAEDLLREEVSILERVAPTPSALAVAQNNLASVLVARGKHAEAELLFRDVILVLSPTDDVNCAKARTGRANALRGLGRLAEAEDELHRALSMQLPLLGAEHPDVALSRTIIAALALKRGAVAEAVREAELAWEARKAHGSSSGDGAETAFVLAQALFERSPRHRRRAQQLALLALNQMAPTEARDHASARTVREWLEAHS